jgi:hypothetical protein
MIAVITGDIINSQKTTSKIWMDKLKYLFKIWEFSEAEAEIYRGDEVQLKCAIEDVFWKAIYIKAVLKSVENLDVRLAIGIGEENYSSKKITESNGTAYVNSGQLLNLIKTENTTLAIKTTDENLTADLSILLKWCSLNFDSWSVATAEILNILINDITLTQEDLAKKLNISQSSVSQRLKRANFDLILETNAYFKNKLTNYK